MHKSASTAVKHVFKMQAAVAGASELAVSTLLHLMHPFGPSTVWQAIHGMFCVCRRERASAVYWLFALSSAFVPASLELGDPVFYLDWQAALAKSAACQK